MLTKHTVRHSILVLAYSRMLISSTTTSALRPTTPITCKHCFDTGFFAQTRFHLHQVVSRNVSSICCVPLQNVVLRTTARRSRSFVYRANCSIHICNCCACVHDGWMTCYMLHSLLYTPHNVFIIQPVQPRAGCTSKVAANASFRPIILRGAILTLSPY
jgi:hypothetical protein